MKHISKEWRTKFINHIEANIEAYKAGYRKYIRYGEYKIFRVLEDTKHFQGICVTQTYRKKRGLCEAINITKFSQKPQYERESKGAILQTFCNLAVGSAMYFYAHQTAALDLLGKNRGYDLMYGANANANIKQIESGELGNFEQITGEQAQIYAESGNFVIAGQYVPGYKDSKGKWHAGIGHVALVVGTRMNPVRTCVYNIGALGREGYQDVPYAFGLSYADAQKKVKYYRHLYEA